MRDSASRVQDSSTLVQERASTILVSGRATALVFEPQEDRAGSREYA
jgi:hypothetical protein